MEWHDLQKKKVTELRDMAKEYPDVDAVSGMHKEELVELVASHLGITRPHRVVEGIDKGKIKAEIRGLKKQRSAALEARDREGLREVRKEIHKRKRALRRAARLH